MNSGELTNAAAAYHEGIQKVAEAYRLVREVLRKYQEAKFLADEKEIDPTIYATILASEAAVSEIEALMASCLDGEQPAGLTASRLAQWKNLPLDWTEQRKGLGFT